VLAELEPDKEEVVNLASGLCNSMNDAFETVSAVFADISPFFTKRFWAYMMVTDSSVDQRKDSLRAIIPFRFSLEPEFPSTRRIIQASTLLKS
jgi:hypothetical protein